MKFVYPFRRKRAFLYNVTYPGSAWLTDGFWIWWSNLLDLYATGYNSTHTSIWHTVIFFRLDTPLELFSLPLNCQSESEFSVTTDGQSASLFSNKPPIWGLRPDFYYCPDSCGFVDVGRSLWREDGFVIYIFADPRQSSHFRVRVL
jgi:hypothetical protein